MTPADIKRDIRLLEHELKMARLKFEERCNELQRAIGQLQNQCRHIRKAHVSDPAGGPGGWECPDCVAWR